MAKDDIKEQPNSRRRLDGNARVASAAAALDAAKIPHVLWGLYPLTIYGIPTVVNGFDFVIEDDYIDAAYEALADAGFMKCASEDCVKNKKRFNFPKAHAHFHLCIEYFDTLDLYKKSEMLWRIPDLSNVDGENIILASDAVQLPGPDIVGRGGRFQEGLHPVRVLSIYQLWKTLLLLSQKEFNKPRDDDNIIMYWWVWLAYITDYCLDNGVFDPSRLTGSYKAFYDAFVGDDRKAREQALLLVGITD